MVTELKEFQKTKDYLICVDSDGCAMDTMDLKHKNCFGPCMIHLWGLEKYEKEIQDYWNQVNLYRMSRGINRFLGLSMVLEYVSREYPDLEIGDITSLKTWTSGNGPFSNEALKAEIESEKEKNGEKKAAVLEMALAWSNQVNQSIKALPKEAATAFEGVKEVLEYLHAFADIAVVSSANQSAVEEEWKRCGLYPYADGLFTQNVGSKKHCLAELSKRGYKKHGMLMIGDAPGDMAAAEESGILFYPILVRKEAESWKRLKGSLANAFLEGSYESLWQENLKQEFKENLSDKKMEPIKIGVPLEGFDQVCRRAAAEGAVLLENREQVLPIKEGSRVSLFGRAQIDYYKIGTGSGGSVNVPYVHSILDGIRSQDKIKVNEELAASYEAWIREHPHDNGGGGWASEPLCQEEMPVSLECAGRARECSDIAVIVIGRTAGESQDCELRKGSLFLTDEEMQMIRNVCEFFEKTVLLLNVPGIMDHSWMDQISSRYPLKAVLYIWQGGMTGGDAAADLLNGSVFPSGKLADTIAWNLEDHASNKNYGNERENEYQEDIYTGYRFFETFCPQKVRYPFGYGLNFTTFSVVPVEGVKNAAGYLVFTVAVKNTGRVYAGKETVQIYAEAPQGKLGKPVKSLVAFEKTRELKPGEEQILTLSVDIHDLASYDDSGITGYPFAWVMEEGTYYFHVGNSVRNTVPVTVNGADRLVLKKTKVLEQLESAMAPERNFERIRPGKRTGGNVYETAWEKVPKRTYDREQRIKERLPKELKQTGNKGIRLKDVAEENASLKDFVAQFTKRELETLVRGEGMGNPKVTPGTASAFGGVGDSLLEYGLPMACTCDGPSGIRMEGGAKATLMPTGTLLACTWDLKLVEELYVYEGRELRRNQIDVLLGPGMNIHRSPRNGRNFEYFSEDPYLTGSMACSVVRGLKSQGVFGTLKHFLCNNQEKERSFVNAVVSERALREIYLKGFEMAVKRAGAKSIMTSYNPVNGCWSASNYDMNTTILRQQWGYDGIVMTDWWAKMNDAVKGGEGTRSALRDMVRAQNDLYMVVSNGGAEINASEDDLPEAVESGRLTVGELQRCAENICRFLIQTPVFYSGREFAVFCPYIKAQKNAENRLAVGLDREEKLPVVMDQKILFSIKEAGEYDVLASFMSEESKMSQMTSDILLNGEILSVFQANGTKGQWAVQKVTRVKLNAGFYELEVHTIKPGTVVRWIGFNKRS